MESEKNLVVLVPDIDIEKCVASLLNRFPLVENLAPYNYKIIRHPMRDSGCLIDPEAYLRPYLNSHEFAFVIFDHDGCGKEKETCEKLEARVTELIGRNGWEGKSACVVIDPEVENWIWVNSQKMAELVGWKNNESLRKHLEENKFWPKGHDKPPKPKEALKFALKRTNIRISPALYQSIASTVPFKSCTSPSFQKFKSTITTWFQPQNP